jgi:glycosyltransferase involved in cell wall biosynthesis
VAKVLWIGDAGCTTGFARVTHSIGERLVSQFGHEIEVLAINHIGDWWDTNLKLFPPATMRNPGDVYGKQRVVEMLSHMPQLVIMLGDPQVLVQYLFENPYDAQKKLMTTFPIIGYIPIDGHNHPPGWSLLGEVMRRVAMSKFGQAQMPGSALVYHGVDTETFYPVSAAKPINIKIPTAVIPVSSKRECKQAFGFDPDDFLVLRVDTNSGRKDWAASWKALQPVMKRHKNVIAHFHGEKLGVDSAVNMVALTDRNLATKARFNFPDLHSSFNGWPISHMQALMNAADLFISTSRGEGFGLTIAEAMACGVPVIAQNVSAIPEVVGPGGILLEPQREITVPSGEDQWLCDIDAFTEAIEHLYSSRAERRKLGAAARQHVVANFSWDTAAVQFNDLITEVLAGS